MDRIENRTFDELKIGDAAGNMLAKQLEYLAEAEAAGIVLGARVPIILTSRADKALTRLSSCALALLWAHYQSGKASAK